MPAAYLWRGGLEGAVFPSEPCSPQSQPLFFFSFHVFQLRLVISSLNELTELLQQQDAIGAELASEPLATETAESESHDSPAGMWVNLEVGQSGIGC